jgi:hypothetical protein
VGWDAIGLVGGGFYLAGFGAAGEDGGFVLHVDKEGVAEEDIAALACVDGALLHHDGAECLWLHAERRCRSVTQGVIAVVHGKPDLAEQEHGVR